MSEKTAADLVPRELAESICAEIRRENLKSRFTLARLQCWGCTTFSRQDPAKMCLSNKNGCNLVTERYAQRVRQGQR